jgi:hypothetical protein
MQTDPDGNPSLAIEPVRCTFWRVFFATVLKTNVNRA